MNPKVRPAIVFVAAATLALAGCGGSSSTTSEASGSASTATASTTVEATVYGQANPPNAPDQVMSMYSVVVPVGASLAPHQHPGQQMGRIMAGELTYTVVKGEVTVFDGTSTPGTPVKSHQVTAGTTVVLKPGTTIAEQAGMIHQAKNVGSEPVKIDLAILVPKNDPFSIPAK